MIIRYYLLGSFKGILNYTNINSSCNIISPASQLQGTNGTEIFIVSFNTSLGAIDTYKLKLGGDDANDNLNPFKAIIEKGFLGGKYVNMIKIAGNATGTFTLYNRTINSSSYTITLFLNKDILPVNKETIEIKGISIFGFGDGYVTGSITANPSIVNSSINFGEKIGDNFLISTSLLGNFNWVITSDLKPSYTGFQVYQQSRTISKIGNSVYVMGEFSGLLQLCNSILNTSIRTYGFLWRYIE